ncbi:MAG: LON peptidase substrate-binding domain-containing protein [Rhodobacteraceae bacterium]|jgi:Lon protease-like protein|nr:LON peptidase substrate-binding domain-containing protein [Paracoccaceae bacterium]
MPAWRPGLADLPGRIPLFPLPGALLLPRARIPLFIFEPRYLAMVEDCMKTSHRLIGMISAREAIGLPQPGPPQLAAVGCAGRLTEFAEAEDGRLMIALSGVSRFHLREEVSGFTPYRRAEVDWAPFARDLGPADEDPGFNRTSFVSLLQRFLDSHGLSAPATELRDAPVGRLIDDAAMLLPLPPEDKQALLEAPGLASRRETLVTLMEFALRGGNPKDPRQ